MISTSNAHAEGANVPSAHAPRYEASVQRGNEDENRTPHSNIERFGPFYRRIVRHRLSANNARRKYIPATRFYGYDWRTGADQYPISAQEFAFRIGLILASAAATGAGIGQCISKLAGG